MNDFTIGDGRSVTSTGPQNTPTASRARSVKGETLNSATITGGQVVTNTISNGLLRSYCDSVEFVRLHPDAVLPAGGTKLAAGLDLVTPESIIFAPGERKTIPLGFALAIPDALHGRIESRSGLALKGLVVLTGVIDADYRGELMVIMQNFSDKKHEFAAGDRVAQLVLRPTVKVPLKVVESFTTDSERGSGGFGSTGR